jgi:uncharacterized protein YcbK (DUF882 family)
MSKRLLPCAPSRRAFLGAGLGLSATALTASPTRAAIAPRALTFENLHTGEKLTATYWADGQYVPESAKQLAWVLRDYRNNQTRPIDPALFDLLYALRETVDTQRPFEVISGYRSPETNAALARASEGVATHSLHMSGKAIDIRVANVSLTHLRNAARSLGRGGVGFYPRSDFVHVDTGRPRIW